VRLPRRFVNAAPIGHFMPILRGLTPPAAHVKKKNFSMSAACLGCGALVADLSGNRLLAVGLSTDP
jgi:hypothetical protein